ncbi:hypothetical protein Leryth_002159, partial [Lithospermum erythrorhizon]
IKPRSKQKGNEVINYSNIKTSSFPLKFPIALHN